jgi:hypothetical protein
MHTVYNSVAVNFHPVLYWLSASQSSAVPEIVQKPWLLRRSVTENDTCICLKVFSGRKSRFVGVTPGTVGFLH